MWTKRKAFDTFFCLEKHFKCTVNTILEQLLVENTVQSDYKPYWITVKAYRDQKHKDYLNRIDYSDLKVFEAILSNIPNNAVLHCANSSGKTIHATF